MNLNRAERARSTFHSSLKLEFQPSFSNLSANHCLIMLW